MTDLVVCPPKPMRGPEPEHRRTHQPVRRRSRLAGREHAESLTRRQANRYLAALERLGKNEKKPGMKRGGKSGTLSLYAEKVYALLADLAVKYSGRVFPSYRGIAAYVRCSVKTAVECVAQLVDRGWLEYDRRMEPTGELGVRGPQVKQISNWYRVKLPTLARQLLESWSKRAAPAGDDAHAQAAQERAQAAKSYEREDFADTPLGKAFSLGPRARAALAAADARFGTGAVFPGSALRGPPPEEGT